LDATGRQLVWEGVWWLLGFGLLGIVVLWERLPLRSVGLVPPTHATFLIGVPTFVPLLLLFPAVQLLLSALGVTDSQPTVDRLVRLPLWLLLAGALRAGVTEEFIFRGYLIERLSAVTGRRRLAATISWAVFVALHLGSWPVGHLVYVALVGGVLTVLYLWRRDLTCNIVAHVLTDGVGLLVVWLDQG
jgi:membrane protease YdiL (CAAX protease family)